MSRRKHYISRVLILTSIRRTAGRAAYGPWTRGSRSKRYCCLIHQSDLLGRQCGKTRDPRFGMRAAVEPRCQPLNIDRRSYREVLQACFRQASVTTLSQPKRADALGERSFNPRSFVILGFPLCRALLLPDGLEDLMLALWAQRHMAWGGLRFGT